MANLDPGAPYMVPTGAGSASFTGFRHRPPPVNWHSDSVENLIQLLDQDPYRENALLLLNKKRERHKELALALWKSFNTVYILLQEVLAVYKLLSPSKLTTKASNRVCNALALLQCIAAHPDTRMEFVKAKIPVYLYPFLKTTEEGKAFEYLRLTSLGVIGALVKGDDENGPEIIHFLLETELFPLCLRCMEVSSELTKTVATFIVSKILMQEEGLYYCCGIAERFYAVGRVLGGMIETLNEKPSLLLVRHIIRCYLSLSGVRRVCDALRHCFPPKLRDPTFITAIREDDAIVEMLRQLIHRVARGH